MYITLNHQKYKMDQLDLRTKQGKGNMKQRHIRLKQSHIDLKQ